MSPLTRKNRRHLVTFQQVFSGGVLSVWGLLHIIEPWFQGQWHVPLAVDAALIVTAAGVHPGMRAAAVALFSRIGKGSIRDPPD